MSNASLPAEPSSTETNPARTIWQKWFLSKDTSLYVVLIFLVVGYLGLVQLDETPFWDDEAFVAIMANNVIATGEFTAWDGRNLWGYRNGAALNSDLFAIDPPLASLVTAASFSILGESTWAGRFPFVLLGLASFWLFFLILKKEFKSKQWLWIYTLGHFGLSLNFLLYIRLCRNYALSLFLSVLLIYLYRRFLESKRNLDLILMTGVGILSFYSSYLWCAVFLLTMGIYHLIYHQNAFSWTEWKKTGLAIALFLFATVPYIFYFRVWQRDDHVPHGLWEFEKLRLVWWFFRELNYVAAFPWVIAIGLVYFLSTKGSQDRDMVEKGRKWGVFCLLFMVFLPLFSPQNTSSGMIAEVRHLVVIIPFLSLLVGMFLWFLHQRSKPLALLVFAILLTTNLFTLNPFHKTWYHKEWSFQWLLPAFIYEVHHKYPTSIGRTIDFLKEEGQPDDLVFASPDYFNYPLLFYVGDQFRICCILNVNPIKPLQGFFRFGLQTHLSQSTISAMDAPLLVDQHFPNWFISFGLNSPSTIMLDYFTRPHRQGGEWVSYQYEKFKSIPVYWRQSHRPELPWRHFGPKRDFDASQGVHIFKRLEMVPAEEPFEKRHVEPEPAIESKPGIDFSRRGHIFRRQEVVPAKKPPEK